LVSFLGHVVLVECGWLAIKISKFGYKQPVVFQQFAPHIAFATLTSSLSFLLVVTKFIKCQCLGAWVHPRRPISMGQAEYNVREEQIMFSSSIPLLLHFPTPFFPLARRVSPRAAICML